MELLEEGRERERRDERRGKPVVVAVIRDLQ